MFVKDVDYFISELEQFNPNDFFKANREELISDFEDAFGALLNIELPEELSDAQKLSVSRQKTDLLIAFISGHLNFFDPKSKVFARINDMGNKTPSGIILPNSGLIL